MDKKSTQDDVTLDFSWIKRFFSKGSGKGTGATPILSFLSKYGFIFLLLIPLLISANIRMMPRELSIANDWATQGVQNSIKNQITQQILQQYPNIDSATLQSEVNKQFPQVWSQNAAQIQPYIQSQAQALKEGFKDDATGETYLGDIDSYFWARYQRNLIEKGMYGDELLNGMQYDNHMLAPEGAGAQINIYPYVEAYLYKAIRLFNPKASYLTSAYFTPMILSFLAIIAAFLIGKKLVNDFTGLVASILVAVNPTILSRSLGSDNDIINAVFPLVIMLFVLYAFDEKNLKKRIIFTALSGLLLGVYSFAWTGWWFMYLFIVAATLLYTGYLMLPHILSKDFKNILADKKIKDLLLFLGVFFVATFIGLSFFGKGSSVITSFKNPLDFMNINTAAKGASIWPNVYTTVAELNDASMADIVSAVGGTMLLWIALLGTVLPLKNFETKNFKTTAAGVAYLLFAALYYFVFVSVADSVSVNIFALMILLSLPLFVGLALSVIFKYHLEVRHSILMIIWFMATIYSATKGVRFILLIVPAFIVSLSMFIGMVIDLVSKYSSKFLDIDSKFLKYPMMFLVLLILLNPLSQSSPLNQGVGTAYHYSPSVDDGWVHSLTQIKLDSQPDAIINSWWDFGHWFKYFADRAVTFDGASQNKPQAHWIGKVLLTSDEDQARAILRMLDCGGNKAFDEIDSIYDDTYTSVNKVYEYLSEDASYVQNDLQGKASQDTIDKINQYMFCEPPEDYFITSTDMVGKSGVWAHFGSWDFKKADLYHLYTENDYAGFIDKAQSELGYTKEDANRFYYELVGLTTDREINDWVAPWPSYIMSNMKTCRNDNETITCPLGVQVGNNGQQNIVLENAKIDANDLNQTSLTYGFYTLGTNQLVGETNSTPSAVEYFDGDSFTRYEVGGNDNFDLLLAKSGDTYSAMLFQKDSALETALYTRLYYLGGQGIQNFGLFHDETGVTGVRVVTWKVKW